MELTDRQKALLKAIIEEYIDTAEPVSSEVIERKYDLGVSPATIRIEMVRLTESGYLRQPHTSAGRVPTSMGFKLYVSELMKERQLPVTAEVSIKEQLMQKRHKQETLLKEAVKALAKQCDMLGLVVDDEGQIYWAGAANILDWPEFYDIDVTRFVLGLFDEFPRLKEIIGRAVGPDPVHILFGEDMEFEYLRPTSFVFTKYNPQPDKPGVIGVIGPARMNFAYVLPYVKYIRDMVTEAMVRQ
ncbi:MAG: Transcriptional regulator of heat shock protein [Microgenomates group bacterium Gr01-1014_7]|nr:MAG: Transcriptional regulator of heat shock protein [Microgenomates group bacterium Gr01-1014_7]